MAKYKMDKFDLSLLRKARHNIDLVRNYNEGTPNSRRVVNRLNTILYKIDDLLKICDPDNEMSEYLEFFRDEIQNGESSL